MKKIRDLINGKKVHFAEPNWTVEQAAKYMKEYDIGAVAVVAQGRVCGMFTERDIMCDVVAEGRNAQSTILSEIMTTKLVTADPNDSYEECLVKMQHHHCRHLPIVAGEELVGMLSLRDLLQIDAMEKLERAKLLDYLLRYEIEVGEYD